MQALLFSFAARVQASGRGHDIHIGTPAVVGRHGLEQVIEMPLNADEQAKMEASAKQLKEVMDKAFKETGVKVRQ